MNSKYIFYIVFTLAPTHPAAQSADQKDQVCAEPGQQALYGGSLEAGFTRQSDQEVIINYVTSLQNMAAKNNSKKNDDYQRLIKGAKSYAARYLAGKGSEEQLTARKVFLAQYKVPSALVVQRGSRKRGCSRLFSDGDIKWWASKWTTIKEI